jgi:hypothetical protein
MSALIQGTELPAMPVALHPEAGAESQAGPAGPAVAIGTLGAHDSTLSVANSNKPITIKVVDVKKATILARDAIHYDFTVPETEQTCRLVGDIKSTGGDVEVLLLTDDQFVFWRANPAALPHSNWEPQRGSDLAVNYDLSGAGNYYLIISNALSGAAHRLVQAKAQVKCALATQTTTNR